MDLVLVMVIVGLTLAARSAWEHSGNDYRASRDKSLDKAGKAAGGKLDPGQRRQAARHHATGYWAREVAGGFPVARTGWHAGWIAHRTAQAHHQAVREEARTTEAETRAGYVAGLKAHRDRQRQAFTEIEQAIKAAAEPVRGKKAVQETADAVVLPFRPRTEPPADEAKAAEPGPYKPRDDARPDDSDWLLPGEKRCELCGGSGQNREGPGVCPACRGWGDAPIDPDGPPAADGTICAACGNPGTNDDPVLAGVANTPLHRSHAVEQQAAYRAVLNGQQPTTANGSPTTNGASPMATQQAEITYDQAITEADKIIDACEQEITRLQMSQIAQMAEHLMGMLNDSGSIGRLSEVDDGIRQEIEAARQTLEAAQAFKVGLQRDHGGINEAHQDAPIPLGAQPEFYQG